MSSIELDSADRWAVECAREVREMARDLDFSPSNDREIFKTFGRLEAVLDNLLDILDPSSGPGGEAS
jgi:hypothetical protein